MKLAVLLKNNSFGFMHKFTGCKAGSFLYLFSWQFHETGHLVSILDGKMEI
jgi:hypothetical protein